MNEVQPPRREIAALYEAQREHFDTGATLPRATRERALEDLAAAVRRYETRIAEALHADLRRPELEAYVAETSLILSEVRFAQKHLRAWMKPRRWVSPLVAQPSRSALHAQPLGPTLILGAWNYPFMLTLLPLVPCLAAGNTAVVKPSELSPASSAVVAELLAETFPPELVACVEGGVDTATELLAQPWSHFFYTGGGHVGRIVARAAADQLARVTLELGGKSPCIVMPSADLDVAAARIAWGKWVNAGQTCVAPDYVLAHRDVAEGLVARLGERIRVMFGDDPQKSPDLARMVNDRHLARVERLIEPDKVAFGGQVDSGDRYIAPTVLKGVTPGDAVMQEEIFGPVLPVLVIDDLAEVVRIVRQHPDPLALYVFSEDPAEQDFLVQRLSFGGGCLNNVLVHLSDPGLPFGGVGSSGTGAYRGKHGFDTFTHYKSVLESHASKLLDLPMKYAPYEGKLDKLKWVLG